MFLKFKRLCVDLKNKTKLMAELQIEDKTFETFIDRSTLESRIAALGKEISTDYDAKLPLLIGVLNGSFMFVAELFKSLSIPCEVTFVRLSSYQKTQTSGQVREVLGLNQSIKNRHIIIVEDIVDTGLTMSELLYKLSVEKPASIQVATMLFKPEALKMPLDIKYVGFEIENRFVVGYGLDYDEQGRNLDAIYALKEDATSDQ
jgi:hypoxanthine phosphoribosyltransferase